VTLAGEPGLTPVGPPAPVDLSAEAGRPTGNLADPFGLWDSPSMAGEEIVSFGLPAGGAGVGDELPAAVWVLPLTRDAGGRATGDVELERRARKVQAINAGLDQASARLAVYLSSRSHLAESVSFSTSPPALAAPEASLEYALNTLEPGGEAGQVSFGLGEDLGRLAGRVRDGISSVQSAGIDWDELRRRLDELVNSVNRQLLHFAWVDTTLDGSLVARTMVNWGSDMATLWQPGLALEQNGAHCRSLQLAMSSRSANLRTVLTVSQIAGKIALAVTTPLGPLQALSLGWLFVREVVMPLLNKVNETE